jgi:capsule polysaccharide modification protein KpsS
MSKTFDEEYMSDYVHYGVNRYSVIKEYILILLKERFRKYFIDKNFIREITSNEKFLFFPLQVQPERNVDIDAPFYANQIDVITNIAKALPVDYKLYVKEHPQMQLRHWRKISEYKEIIELPNVKLIHPLMNPKILLEKCSLVINIAGTAGLEAALYQKPSIVFADVLYSSLPSVHRLTSLEELPNAIRESLKKEVKLSDVNEFMNLLDRNSFEFDFFGNDRKIFNEFHGGGFLVSNEISMDEFKSFLEKNKENYEILTSEHIKKINQYKKIGKN